MVTNFKKSYINPVFNCVLDFIPHFRLFYSWVFFEKSTRLGVVLNFRKFEVMCTFGRLFSVLQLHKVKHLIFHPRGSINTNAGLKL